MIVFTGGSSPLGLEIINNLRKTDKVLAIYNKNKIEYKLDNVEWVQINFFKEFDPKLIISKLSENEKITLVCFAAHNTDSMIVNMEYKDWKNAHLINLDTNFILSKLLLPKMIANKWGRIVHISSTRALYGDVGISAYASSKSALLGLSRSIAKEYGRLNITSNVLSLGYFKSNLWLEINEEIKKRLVNQIPSKVLGESYNIANAINFIINSNYVNGSIINIDGGI